MKKAEQQPRDSSEVLHQMFKLMISNSLVPPTYIDVDLSLQHQAHVGGWPALAVAEFSGASIIFPADAKTKRTWTY